MKSLVTDSNSILLHAASRGARLQFFYKEVGFKGKWVDTDTRPSICPIQEWRIHPDDLFLRFGTISSNVRNAAADPPEFLDHAFQGPRGYHMFDIYAKHTEMVAYNNIAHNKKRRSMYLLLLAEALTYEGL